MPDTFNVGKKIKAIRREKNLTLKKLSWESNVSTTQISEIERGLSSPTIGTLMKIISALGQDTSIFFENARSKKVSLVRKNERPLIVDKKNHIYMESLTNGIIDSLLKVIITRPQSGHENIPGGYQHAGEELIYVNKGEIQVELDRKTYVLKEGDSIHFRGEMCHSIKNILNDEAELIIVVITPHSH